MTNPPVTPFADRLVSKVASRLIVWLGCRAHARGDMHEFAHMRAAIDGGNSKPCERAGRCHLDPGHATTTEHRKEAP